jgi:hypothetical protein
MFFCPTRNKSRQSVFNPSGPTTVTGGLALALLDDLLSQSAALVVIYAPPVPPGGWTFFAARLYSS